MAKFDNAKVGDKLWDILLQEWGTVEYIDSEEIKVVYIVGNDEISVTYNLDGIYGDTKTPVLYYREKFIDTSDDKPFNLVEYLKENLQPTEFRIGEENFYLYFDAEDEMWYSFSSEIDIAITVYFKTCTRELVDELDENKITPQQLKQAYKELGWL